MNKFRINIPSMSLSIPMLDGHFAQVSPGWSYHDHHHSWFEWLLCVEGDVTEWVKDEAYPLHSGDWLLIKPGVRHSTFNNSEKIMMKLIHLWSSISITYAEPTNSQKQLNHSHHEADLAHAVARLLESNDNNTVYIHSLSELFHLNRSHLSRVFAKVYGMSPRQYLSILQLRRAKELLIHTHKSVEQIAIELGFSSLSHFSRQFKRWTGISPQQFRSSLSR
jgi:AraC-like DNA-binding protein